MRKLLQGTIDYTDNAQLIYGVLGDISNPVIVIDMDEESDPNISQQHPRVIGGSCLIPPMEALIAAADGEREVFRSIYAEHFDSPFIDNYVGALIISLCLKGASLLIYYHDELGIINDMIDIFWMKYGIKIGVVGEYPCVMDPSCMPIWLQFLYRENTISPEDFLFNYPINTRINDSMVMKLIHDMRPAGNINEQTAFIYDLVPKIKCNPNIINPLAGIE